MYANLKPSLLLLAFLWALSSIGMQLQLCHQTTRTDRLESRIESLQQTIEQMRRPGL